MTSMLEMLYMSGTEIVGTLIVIFVLILLVLINHLNNRN